MIDYDSFSRCHLTIHAGAKELIDSCEGEWLERRSYDNFEKILVQLPPKLCCCVLGINGLRQLFLLWGL